MLFVYSIRPGRKCPRVCVDEDTYDDAKKNHTPYIIHSYGHGGSGITVAWGCATHCVKLVQQLLGSPTMQTHSPTLRPRTSTSIPSSPCPYANEAIYTVDSTFV